MDPLQVDGLPEHCPIGVTADGRGPYDSAEPEFDHMACWCGQVSVPCPVEAAQLAVMERAARVLGYHFPVTELDGQATCGCGAVLDSTTAQCHFEHVTVSLVAHNLLAVHADWGVAAAGRAVAVQPSWADAEQTVQRNDDAGGPKTTVVTRLTTGWVLPFFYIHPTKD